MHKRFSIASTQHRPLILPRSSHVVAWRLLLASLGGGLGNLATSLVGLVDGL